MKSQTRLLCACLLAAIAASCSAGYSRPRAQALVEDEQAIYALVDPDPNPNTETTIARLLSTTDGKAWQPVGQEALPDNVGLELNSAGVAEECDPSTASCYRVTSPEGGISLERSRDAGNSWTEVWSISQGRLDYQDRCCGTRPFSIQDLEYVPETGLVAVALAEYGLLSRGTDAEIRLDTLGRSARPESELMVGLYVEPLFAGVIALAIGYITTEQRLSRLRNRLEYQLGSAEHAWLTDRARQVPIVLPLVFFLAFGGVVAAMIRVFQRAERDLPHASGWFALVVTLITLIAASAAGHWLHRRQWTADAETRARPMFAAAARKALHAQTVGTVSTAAAFAAAMTPLIAWSTGAIDSFDTALKIALGFSAVIGAAFWIWEASRPPLPDSDGPSTGERM